MSNLGGYQWMTETAKKVGGPVSFVLLIASSGAVLYKGAEVLFKQGKKRFEEYKSQKTEPVALTSKEYTVKSSSTGNKNLTLDIGDKFKVLEQDHDAVLIEKIGDSNNPYIVSKKWIQSISDYT